MPVTEWDFVGRRSAGPVPKDGVAAVTAALQACLTGDKPAEAVSPVNVWGLAGRREAIGEGPFLTRAELPAGR